MARLKLPLNRGGHRRRNAFAGPSRNNVSLMSVLSEMILPDVDSRESRKAVLSSAPVTRRNI